jgi:hypothetical protein
MDACQDEMKSSLSLTLTGKFCGNEKRNPAMQGSMYGSGQDCSGNFF